MGRSGRRINPGLYPKLTHEMTARGVRATDIAGKLGKDRKTLYQKLQGIRDFTLPEALAIHEAFFPDTDFLTLFRRSDSPGNGDILPQSDTGRNTH